jgi:D-alanyl-D-alanine carboxypeptidase/D-alanyl-D-alanine-endopeptidase (penicillin-binding protein 4)
MHLKTGSLEDVSAIAGYVHKNNGKTYVVFSIINSPNVNDGVGKNFESILLDWTTNNL